MDTKIALLTTMKRFIKKIKRNYTDHGFYITLKKIISHLMSPIFLHRVYRIYTAEIENMEVPQPIAKSCKIKMINCHERYFINQIENMEEWLCNKIEEKINNQGICLVALDGEKVAGFNMISFGEVYVPLIEQKRVLKKDEAWSDQITVNREYRCTGLGKALRYAAIKELQKMGMKTFTGGTLLDNEPSLRLARSVGFKEIIDIHFRKILGYRNWRNVEVPHEAKWKN